MSTRYNNGSHYENHQRAAELHDQAAHAHRAGALHGKEDHLTAHELSRQALEHSGSAHWQTHFTVGTHSTAVSRHQAIAACAYGIWESRGRPEDGAAEDWLRAEQQVGHPFQT